ncbi:Uma2 family endonuclease [Candidatus Electrothrix sp.]|uniref:Uma2 family endonuclease n=1 Tax=Candidatus Electrothrix sp. TaxID=2170559 RepID=UPI004057614C
MVGQVQSQSWISPEEYLNIERRSTSRSEYVDGEMFAMAGATRQHNRISSNLVSEINQHIKSGDCNIYSSDLRVHVPSTGYFTYPDIVITCGKEEFTDAHNDVLVNPLVIIEILSDSTASIDRGKKFEQYRELASFVEYLLIEQRTPHIEQYILYDAQEWRYRTIRGIDEQVIIQAIDCTLLLRDIYHKVDLLPRPAHLHSIS